MYLKHILYPSSVLLYEEKSKYMIQSLPFQLPPQDVRKVFQLQMRLLQVDVPYE